MFFYLDLDKAQKIFEEVISAHPTHFPAYSMLIQNLESSEFLKTQLPPVGFVKYIKSKEGDEKPDVKKITETLEKIVTLANTVIKEVDKDALLVYYGIKTDTRPDAAKIKS